MSAEMQVQAVGCAIGIADAFPTGPAWHVCAQLVLLSNNGVLGCTLIRTRLRAASRYYI